jgi:hypothetical protein
VNRKVEPTLGAVDRLGPVITILRMQPLYPVESIERGMAAGGQERKRCLWHAEDGRCASCKARRIKHDVLGQKDYEMCVKERDYPTCEFFKERPVPPVKRRES